MTMTELQCCQLLLRYGADPNSTTDSGFTPLCLAAAAANLRDNGTSKPLLELLLAKGAAVSAPESTDGFTALHLAVQRRDVAAVKVLLTAGAQVDARDRYEGITPLLGLIMVGTEDKAMLEVLALLIEHGAKVNVALDTETWSALGVAAHRGLSRTCKVLLGSGANPNFVSRLGLTPLMAAGGDIETAKILLQGGAGFSFRSSF